MEVADNKMAKRTEDCGVAFELESVNSNITKLCLFF